MLLHKMPVIALVLTFVVCGPLVAQEIFDADILLKNGTIDDGTSREGGNDLRAITAAESLLRSRHGGLKFD